MRTSKPPGVHDGAARLGETAGMYVLNEEVLLQEARLGPASCPLASPSPPLP